MKKRKEGAESAAASSEDLKKATEETLTSAQKLGEIIYKQEQSGQAARGDGEKKDEKKSQDKGKGDAEEGEVVS